MTAPHPLGQPEPLRAAFQELHAARLHGFALLLSGGDRDAAARAASETMADASARLADLTHPERAAAWLRARVVRRLTARRLLRLGNRSPRPRTVAEGARALTELGVEPELAASLAALGSLDRAALIASDLEGLDARDVATVIGRSPAAAARMARRARSQLLEGAGRHALSGESLADGPVRRQVRMAAARAGIGSLDRP